MWANALWANAQRDGRPAKYRWRPLFNALKFGWLPLLQCRAVTLPRRETRWNLLGCPKLPDWSQPLVGQSSPYCGDTWRRYCCLICLFRLSICALVAKIYEWCDDIGDLLQQWCWNWINRRRLMRKSTHSVDHVVGRQQTEMLKADSGQHSRECCRWRLCSTWSYFGDLLSKKTTENLNVDSEFAGLRPWPSKLSTSCHSLCGPDWLASTLSFQYSADLVCHSWR